MDFVPGKPQNYFDIVLLSAHILAFVKPVLRTSVLTPDTLDSFLQSERQRSFDHRILVAFDVCREVANCAGAPTDAPVVGLDTADANVPAACVSSGTQVSCSWLGCDAQTLLPLLV